MQGFDPLVASISKGEVMMSKHIDKIRFTLEKAQLDIEDAVFEKVSTIEATNAALLEALEIFIDIHSCGRPVLPNESVIWQATEAIRKATE